MFTIGDIRNIAIQIEENGEKTYREAARRATTPQIAKTLQWLADEEKHHAKWFSSLKSDKPLTAKQQEVEAVGRRLLQDMLKGHPFLLDDKELDEVESLRDLFARSKTFEHDTIVFYQFLLGVIDDAETGKQLEKIIEEERAHIEQLEAMELLQRVGSHCTTADRKKSPC
ncbi:MAG: ferritin family protein [Desulforhopalus sp.]